MAAPPNRDTSQPLRRKRAMEDLKPFDKSTLPTPDAPTPFPSSPSSEHASPSRQPAATHEESPISTLEETDPDERRESALEEALFPVECLSAAHIGSKDKEGIKRRFIDGHIPTLRLKMKEFLKAVDDNVPPVENTRLDFMKTAFRFPYYQLRIVSSELTTSSVELVNRFRDAVEDANEIGHLIIRIIIPTHEARVTRSGVWVILATLAYGSISFKNIPAHLEPLRQVRHNSCVTPSDRPTLQRASTAPPSPSSPKRTRSNSLLGLFPTCHIPLTRANSAPKKLIGKATRTRTSSESSQLRPPASRATAMAHRQKLADRHHFVEVGSGSSAIEGCLVPGVCAIGPLDAVLHNMAVEIIYDNKDPDHPKPIAASVGGMAALAASGDKQLCRHILRSFRLYCTSETLLSAIAMRWNAPDVAPAKLIAERTRLVDFIVLWLQSFWRWENDLAALGDIIQLYNDHISTAEDVSTSARKEICEAIERVRRFDKPQAPLVDPQSVRTIPASGYVAPRKGKLTMDVLCAARMSAREVAHCLARRANELYCEIDGVNWFVYVFRKNKDIGQALLDFLSYANRLHIWVVETIASEKTPMDRATRIGWWIDVADGCLSVGDFCSMVSILNALQISHIRNMRASTLLVKWESKMRFQIMKGFEEAPMGLRDVVLIDGTRVPNKFVAASDAAGPPAVPDAGFLLTLVERLRVLPENQLTRASKQTRDVNLLNLQFAENLYKFVERVEKHRVPFRFEAAQDGNVRSFVELELLERASNAAQDKMLSHLDDLFDKHKHKHLIDEPKDYYLEQRNGPPVVLKPGEGFDYCLTDKMTIVPLNDGDGLKLDATLIDV
ncbi:ras GEF [Schizophyllum commune Loenen D]|nr:ras GEF [Schizophyllum commune Loenen D]